MISQRFNCKWNNSRLGAFLDDSLPELENVQLADHLTDCEECRQQLELLAAGSRFWAELRDAIPASSPKSSKDEPDSISPKTLQHGAWPAKEPISLDFLEPSPNGDVLGRLGPYEITGVLGHGGFGIVLKANDPALHRTVAIKVLSPQLAGSAAARTRFAREARAAAAVVHDNVVAVHAVDSWNGLPYLVMTYVQGQSLQRRVDRDGPLPIKEVLRIGMQTALGLAAAHGQGLVHRDVKPSNILLENGVERVKLSDFGLARAVDDASLTQSGVVSGTPQYMSPEQAQGEVVDFRSDLFGLGSVLYFICTGHPPFRANSTPAVLRRVCDERPRPLREINSDVPVWLAEIVERLHSKQPGGRYGSAAEIAEILQHHLADLQRTGTSNALCPPSPSHRPERQLQKSAAPILLTAAVLVAAIISGLVYSVWPAPGGGDTDRQAVNAGTENTYEQSVIGSGQAASKTWDIADFTAVKLESAFRADISQGKEFKVTTSSDDNVLNHIQVFKEGKMLTVRLERGLNYRLKEPLKAEITLPALEALEIKEASKAMLKGFRSEGDLKLKISGGGMVEGTIDVGMADFEVRDAGVLALKGSAKAARLKVRDASQLKLPEFLLKQCMIEQTDSSTAQITIRSDKLFSARLSNSSILSGSVDAPEVKLQLKDASRATLRGTAKNAELAASDSSNVQLAGLMLEDASVTLSSSSRATVNARKSLKYLLSSSALLEYLGDPPSVAGSKTGAATILRRK
jgi:eukaryotic-like serine/threonine-protein kinase